MGSSVKIGMVVGEHSGDLLGAELITALRARERNLIIEGVCGPKMQLLGAHSFFPMERLNVMGFIDPLFRLAELWWRRRSLIKHWKKNPPAIVLTIDAPDFNLGLAKYLKQAGIKVVHYVSPTVWAWRPRRIYTVAASVDHLLTLFPFEAEYYKKVDLPVSFVGHPLADRLQSFDQTEARSTLSLLPFKNQKNYKILAMLPGSRTKEIKTHLPIFLETVKILKEKQPDLTLDIIISAVDETKAALIYSILVQHKCLYPIFISKTNQVVGASDAVLVVSGTATLEILLCLRPMVVAYKMGRFTYWLAKRLIKTKYIALPNILANTDLVPECIQERCTPAILAKNLEVLLNKDQSNLIAKFKDIKEELKQNAAEKAAKLILTLC